MARPGVKLDTSLDVPEGSRAILDINPDGSDCRYSLSNQGHIAFTVTNPFLKQLLATFLHLGGRRDMLDFDELGINDVVETLRNANMEAVLRDFGDRNPAEDPVIHFYELFLNDPAAVKTMKTIASENGGIFEHVK